MIKTHLIKVFHSYANGKKYMTSFFEDISKTLEGKKMTFGINFSGGETYFSYTSDDSTYAAFESQFYSYFNNFQLTSDDKGVWNYDLDRTVIGELKLTNNWFYPFNYSTTDNTEFIFNIFRSFENFGISTDKVGVFMAVDPMVGESFSFFIKTKLAYKWFKIKLFFQFFKYIFNHKIKSGWKGLGNKYFKHKIEQNLFGVKLYIVIQGENKELAKGKLKAFFNNFSVFKNYPLNDFRLKIHDNIKSIKDGDIEGCKLSKYMFTSEELSSIFHFPNNPKNETSLLKVTSKKLALPIGAPIFDYKELPNGEKKPINYPSDINIIGTSDYRSTKVPVGIYDEDRLRHLYVVGKTGTGKTKFLSTLMIDDLKQGRGIGVIDPHGDLIEEIMNHIPENRIDDVIIFDPTDDKFPFCFNPLDVKSNESKQILAKGFIDIFKKFFGTNWNPKLEHVLRMIFLALLEKENSTLFDIIRALTDKDFRYEMIDAVDDDVVKNFWINEFAGWSQQFNSEAIMPILNKVGQLLSIDILRNIFSSHENKLDFREMMDDSKILLVKLPKGKLQEEIMGFLGAMIVTKIFQSAMGRQGTSKNERIPFFLYVDEFQNFATETFNEILSEARKYGLGLTIAHQFLRQIPNSISDALFGNVGTLISFRISSEDAMYMEKHFDPFLGSYDLANLNQREFYCKLLVKGQVKDPFSMKSLYLPDIDILPDYISRIYDSSRKKYSRSLQEANKKVIEEQKDVIEKVIDFAEPII
ncbi:MAG: type IV secretion system DNA-binding domain-containing protein [Candidatus Gracilibacteria bacterium]